MTVKKAKKAHQSMSFGPPLVKVDPADSSITYPEKMLWAYAMYYGMIADKEFGISEMRRHERGFPGLPEQVLHLYWPQALPPGTPLWESAAPVNTVN